MEPIYYKEAAALLGISEDTLRHAVSREVLSKLPRQGQKQRLIKEQVMLFVSNGSKKRLSLDALTPEENRRWKEYARSANTTSQAGPQVAQREDIRAIVQEEVTEQTEQLEEAFAAFLLQMGMQFRELRHSLKETSNRQNREVPQGVPFLVTH